VLERVRTELPSLDQIRANRAVPESVPRRYRIKLKRIVGPGLDEMAVYSDDRPIEIWCNIVGFIEAFMPSNGNVEGAFAAELKALLDRHPPDNAFRAASGRSECPSGGDASRRRGGREDLP
jgi:hypothetical protein